MRLYKIHSAVPYFVGTQAEAKRDARMCKCAWFLEEVPTDKEGLIAYLNGRETIEITSDYEPQPTFGGRISLTNPEPPKLPETLEEFDRSLDRQGPPAHRLAERAAFLGTSEEVTVLTDRIGELDGWPLGQVALAAASRLKELAS